MKWEKVKVDVRRNSGQYTAVDAEALGPLCVHRPLVVEGCTLRGWVVTHIATGLICGAVVSRKRDAKQIAEHLVLHYGAVFSLPTNREVSAAVPHEVVAWLRECSAQMKYIAPVPA